MTRLLIKNLNDKKGFTLVELLVAITIIAILSTIGIVVFTDAQKNARDARRKADVDAIAKALESGRAPGSLTYTALADTQFSNGTIPLDNNGTLTKSQYCVKESSTAYTPIADFVVTTTWPASLTTGTNCPAGDGTWSKLGTIAPATAAKAWRVCARLESSTNTDAEAYSTTKIKVYCKGSGQ